LEEAQLSTNGDGLQIGPNFFTKVSDSTLLPPTHRLKQDMEDIAKGLKIARTIGGMAAKAVKTVQETIQSTQGLEAKQTSPQSPASAVHQSQPMQSPSPPYATPEPQSTPGSTSQPPSTGAVLYCDQCGTRIRPGKHFCNNCGNQLT
jgi:hypothetical protein